MPRRRATIYDVARRAGVSIATVSRVLKNFPAIAPPTRQRVETAMRHLDYRPSALAVSLAASTGRSFGLIVPAGNRAYSSLFLSEVLAGAAEAAAQNGACLHILTVGPGHKLSMPLERLLDRVEGLLVLDEATGHRSVRTLLESGIRTVLLNAADSALPSVTVNNREGAAQAIDHLVALGHRRIACIGGHSGIGGERMEGYAAALKKVGGQAVAMIDARFDRDRAQRAALRLLRSPAPPTAFAVASDWMATAVLSVAQDCGFSVPDQCSVIGFDDAIIAESCRPTLTTIRQPLREMGRVGMELLQKPKWQKKASNMLLATELIVRTSTAAAKDGRR